MTVAWFDNAVPSRKLHTPTNQLLLSLAASDLLVGLVVMPSEVVYMQSCWYLGDTACALFGTISFIATSCSVGNMVLISADRYVAICQPLHYTTKVTPRRAQGCVCLCWGAVLLYNCLILLELLRHPGIHKPCQGECVMFISSVSSSVDLVFTFVGPTTVIIVLYSRVFVVAVGQARAMRSNVSTVVRARETVGRSERKAARTLGIVVVVFLTCFCPYYCLTLTGLPLAGSAGNWLLYLNSCLNPVIYALFYPWFRKAVKLIITLHILRPNSCETNVL